MERALNAYLLYFIIDFAIHSVSRQFRTMHVHRPTSYILSLSMIADVVYAIRNV